ncbi:uncharacterized protein K02A2.6-like [Toxorhynchites rutilus septentrionalis]|uniref:uncharacterized protein K02A2.6-like n=1 Tax=Toxorhynchites rutilus septentrionalis TaxID=329112 RepID=UPI00247AC504|nr:uncharacterized protein K02A2.6-like [Toxorhynchites rutilus septentrionalis]
MDKTTAGDVIKELSVMFSRYGIPALLKADNAPQFSSECIEFKEFCDSHGVKLSNTIPYWPQSNGEVERQNRSILKRLRIAHELGRDWREELCHYLLTYHSTKHPTTGKSPAEIMFGRRIKSKLPTISTFQEEAEVRENDAIIKQKGKEYADRRRGAKESEIEEGDEVLVKRMRKSNKLDTDFANEEFVVCHKKGTDTKLQLPVQPEPTDGSGSDALWENVAHSEPAPDVEAVIPGSEVITPTASTERIRKQPAKFRDYLPH